MWLGYNRGTIDVIGVGLNRKRASRKRAFAAFPFPMFVNVGSSVSGVAHACIVRPVSPEK